MLRTLIAGPSSAEASYAVKALALCSGVPVTDRDPAVFLHYGARGAGSGTINVPRDAMRWQSGAAPSVSSQWSRQADGSIAFDEDVLYATFYHLSLQRERDAPLDSHGRRIEGFSFAEDIVSSSLDGIIARFRGALLAAQHARFGWSLHIAPWPSQHPFAAMLSHDIDRVRERELFHLLAAGNRLARHLRGGQFRPAVNSCRSLARSILTPRPPDRAVRRIRDIERRYNYRSTWFLLEDRYWARYGAQYRFEHSFIRSIAETLIADRCELGVHGGYYVYNDTKGYAAAARSLEAAVGVATVGIRNHYLRFSYPETWRAQAAAGFRYDTTLGFSGRIGYRAGTSFPFAVFDAAAGRTLPLVELSLTVMDGAIVESALATDHPAAIAEVVASTCHAGGLFVANWHNTNFAHPEFPHYEQGFEAVLDQLAATNAWVATGAEIAGWWTARDGVGIRLGGEPDYLEMEALEDLDHLVLRIDSGDVRSVEGASARMNERSIEFPVIRGGHVVRIQLSPAARTEPLPVN